MLGEVVNEVWAPELLGEGMLWSSPLTLYTQWQPGESAYLFMLANRGQLYSVIEVPPPGSRATKSGDLARYLDTKMQSLRQIHFMQQAAARGGYY